MYKNSVYALALTATATIISGCQSDSNISENHIETADISDITGTHYAIFTPETDTDQYGASCRTIHGQIQISDSTDVISYPSLTAILVSVPIDKPQDEEQLDAGDIGSIDSFSAMLNRNGAIESTQFTTLGDWGVANQGDIPIEFFEEFDLDSFDDFNSNTSSTTFSGASEDLYSVNSDKAAIKSITGNVFHGGEWTGPIGNQGSNCSGTWEMISMEDSNL